MVRGDGGFTDGMIFVIFFDQGDAIPPATPLNSSPEYFDPDHKTENVLL